ncbi:MAG TPA: sigma-70 family RNA polymerase sigma factor [Polyangia bacterium]|nr:sigma-70 family RNA polymerase sigma factor [Polyangia bacterium]
MAAEKNQLVEQHLGLVQAIARKVKKTLGARIELDDLVAYGAQGLVEAAERYDARPGVAFTTFAYYRIRGAMFDGLRTMGWYSRADYARYRAEERANEYLQSHADRSAEGSGASQAADAGEALAAVAQVLSGVAAVHITSLEAAATIADTTFAPPDARLDTGRLGTRVREAVTKLPEKERRLLELYYFEEKTLEEAGSALGLSKSWACRLHARAVDLLRAAMSDAL